MPDAAEAQASSFISSPNMAKDLSPEIVNYEADPEDGFLDVDLGDGYLPPQSPRIYIRSSAPYIADQGMERYNQALRSLIPVRRKATEKKDTIQVDQAGLLSFVFSSWISKLMYKAHRKGLVSGDIPRGSPLDSCDYNVQRLEMLWQEEIRKFGPSGASLPRAVWRFVKTRVIVDWLIFTISSILGFLTPMIFMRKLLEFSEDSNSNTETGLILAFSLGLCEFLRLIFFTWRFVLSFRTAVRLRVACLALMYKKILRLNSFDENSMGQLLNIFANDSQRIFDMIVFGPMIIGGPMVLITGVAYVLCTLSPWALSGILVFIAFYPVQYFISWLCSKLRRKTVQAADQRINLMNEILTHIKTVKMNAWEGDLKDEIDCIRSKEQGYIQKTSYLSSFGSSLAPTVPIMSSIVSFLSHLGSGNTLSAAQAFSVQAVYSNSIRDVVRSVQMSLTAYHDAIIGLKRIQAFPFVTVMVEQARNFVNITQIALSNYIEADVGLKRMQKCLLVEEIPLRIQRPIDRSQAISIGGASFCRSPSWHPLFSEGQGNKSGKIIKQHLRKSDLETATEEREKLNGNVTCHLQPVLQGINFSVTKGQMVGICGPVGSGKTSLMRAILGQMRLIDGQFAKDGSCAYVSQQAWITNGTLRENILFGEPFVSTRYYTVINSCALNEDLNQFPGGDLTEIGERGINLSGGQKQRIALARALYANRDIYLLDDPLSAVDVNVANHIFENYFKKELREKTVVLVCHQVQYLHHCNEVYFLRDGCIIERGTHEELLKLDKEYASMVKQVKSTTCEASSSTPNTNAVVNNCKEGESKDEKKDTEKRNMGESLLVPEPSNLGSLKIDTYCQYISAGGGYFTTFLVLCVFLANIGSTAFSSWWLATWIKAGGGNYTLLVNDTAVLSSNLGDNPYYEFYQTVYASTIGLIILTCGLRCLVFTKVTLRASSILHNELFKKISRGPMVFFESNPIGRLQNVFSRDMDEVDSRLPGTVENLISNFWILSFAILIVCVVFPWFFVALIPLCIVYYFMSRIFRKAIRDLKRLENTTRSPVFSNLLETAQGLNTIRAFNKEGEYIQRFFQLFDENTTCNYLWNVGMRWLAVRINLLAVLTLSIVAFLVVILHGHVAPAMAGLALSYSWHMSGILQYTTRLFSETEVRFISVERILTYIENVLTEGKPTCSKPLPSWPAQGRISFENVNMNYRNNLPNSLCNVSFNVLPGEKIGIVGRTGSGKSSLTVALFRLVEINSGHIKLDGVDIADINLTVLRDKISIIPQDPVVFSGTIRSNLDRKKNRNDMELWDALEKTKLADKIRSLPLKLDTAVKGGSSGLSDGECQLLCLTRALLKSSKVIVFDEATASIDPETEAAVQSTIWEEFNMSTVLIIAHRLSTITNCDRVLVMDAGKVIEFEEPQKLLENTNSLFFKMMASLKTQ
ncbi:ABC-transporter, subfamily C member 08 [Frankliniella occidentalis]|nr:ABC-transporter, subfamily C member 08 [Frankliniella occidentalis]